MSSPQRDVVVAVLGSGSKGNVTYVGDGLQGALIDCGLSARQIGLRLEAVGLGDAPIDAVLLTHEHGDHVRGARVLDNNLFRRLGRRVPFYSTAGTARWMRTASRPSRLEPVQAGRPVALGPWRAEPCSVSHDTADPVAWTLDLDGFRVGVYTDLGRPTRLVEHQLASVDIAVLEFNHDVEMLLEGPYPWPLKQRIRSAHGHLSNDQAAELLTRVAARSPRLRQVVLAHLSEENNLPERALSAASRALHSAGRRDVAVAVARQEVPIEPVVVAGRPPSPQVGLFDG